MVTWFPRRSKRSDPSRHKSRRTNPHQVVNRVDLSELTPSLPRYLGHAAYLQLSFFETLSRAVVTAPSTPSKETVSRVAAIALTRHHELVAELERIGESPSAAMEPFVEAVDEFQRVTLGNDWFEILVTYYVASGILDDAFVNLAHGLPDDYGPRFAKLLSNDETQRLVASELRTAIDANPRLASRLAVWGRRLVGDVLLMARSALDLPVDTAPDDPKLEPILTELIAAHTRRMDDLGLTA